MYFDWINLWIIKSMHNDDSQSTKNTHTRRINWKQKSAQKLPFASFYIWFFVCSYTYNSVHPWFLATFCAVRSLLNGFTFLVEGWKLNANILIGINLSWTKIFTHDLWHKRVFFLIGKMYWLQHCNGKFSPTKSQSLLFKYLRSFAWCLKWFYVSRSSNTLQ